MPAIDLITALGRLLRDGALRDALATHPQAVAEQLRLRDQDQSALLRLIPEDLEVQAEILLRKRFDLVRRIIPETCGRLDPKTWRYFHGYARSHWPADSPPEVHDACDFCQYLDQHQEGAPCHREWNRLRFALSNKRVTLHFLRRVSIRQQNKAAIQLLLRFRSPRWREIVFHFGLST